ncbi:MAG TPA: DUF2617 family protein [Planctomycetaceae bacterium]|nr:DUF2617 family protein [Planctomycetaceae bacterium]
MLFVRPKVAELTFRLYGRSLHPELFEIVRSHTIEQPNYRVQIHITSAGHLITWKSRGVTLTEVAASVQHPLPKQRQLLAYPLRGSHQKGLAYRGGVEYTTSFELEPVSASLFWTIQQQLGSDSESGLLYRFGASGRVAMGAVSYIYTETRARRLCVQAIHTFPDDCAIVKSESVFRLPE